MTRPPCPLNRSECSKLVAEPCSRLEPMLGVGVRVYAGEPNVDDGVRPRIGSGSASRAGSRSSAIDALSIPKTRRPVSKLGQHRTRLRPVEVQVSSVVRREWEHLNGDGDDAGRDSSR